MKYRQQQPLAVPVAFSQDSDLINININQPTNQPTNLESVTKTDVAFRTPWTIERQRLRHVLDVAFFIAVTCAPNTLSPFRGSRHNLRCSAQTDQEATKALCDTRSRTQPHFDTPPHPTVTHTHTHNYQFANVRRTFGAATRQSCTALPAWSACSRMCAMVNN